MTSKLSIFLIFSESEFQFIDVITKRVKICLKQLKIKMIKALRKKGIPSMQLTVPVQFCNMPYSYNIVSPISITTRETMQSLLPNYTWVVKKKT